MLPDQYGPLFLPQHLFQYRVAPSLRQCDASPSIDYLDGEGLLPWRRPWFTCLGRPSGVKGRIWSTVGVIMIHHLPLVDPDLSRNNVAVQRGS